MTGSSTAPAKTSWTPTPALVESNSETDESPTERPSRYLYFCTACACLNSALLGYDIGCSGGAFFLAQKDLGLSVEQTEVAIGSMNVCAVFGAILSRNVSDRFGRRRTLAMASLFFLVGSLVLATAGGFGMLLVGRILVGLGVGVGLSIDPMYISEVSPASHRGFLVSWSEISINIGVLLGFLCSYVAGRLPVKIGWRVILGIGAVMPTIMLFLSTLCMPESPRYLVQIGKQEMAKKVLARLFPSETQSDRVIREICASIEEEKKASASSSWRTFFCESPPELRLQLIIVVGVAFYQQASGVEAFMYYTPFMLRNVGFETRNEILGFTALMGCLKTLVLIPTAVALDRSFAGRRRLLLASFSGMSIALVILSIGVWLTSKLLLVVGILGYVFGFSIGAGPICWLFASEILPTSVRARGMVLAAGTNRLVASIISISFLSATGAAGGTAFIFFSVTCVTAWFFVFQMVPETRGRTLEEMQGFFRSLLARNRRLASRSRCRSCCGYPAVGRVKLIPQLALAVPQSRSESQDGGGLGKGVSTNATSHPAEVELHAVRTSPETSSEGTEYRNLPNGEEVSPAI